MFARIEVTLRPEFPDPRAQLLLRRLEKAHPLIRKRVRWARLIDLCWLELPVSREMLIPAISEVFWDRVTQWMFTGNLIPAAAGKTGGIADLTESSPNRPGKFWGLERRFRPGVTDAAGQVTLEAFEIVLRRKIPEGRAASGSFLLLEGPELDEANLGVIAREVFCNELLETWSIVDEVEIRKSERFHQERIKRDFLKTAGRGFGPAVETFPLSTMGEVELDRLSAERSLGLSIEELKVLAAEFARPDFQALRTQAGMTADPTDVELALVSQAWGERHRSKILDASVDYFEDHPAEHAAASAGADPHPATGGADSRKSSEIPSRIDGLFRTTLTEATRQLPKTWLLSVFGDSAGILAFDDDDAIAVQIGQEGTPTAFDAQGGAFTGMLAASRDILGAGMGAKPIFHTDVLCSAPAEWEDVLPARVLHPSRVLDGLFRGVQEAVNKSGVPCVNGATVLDAHYLGKPVVFFGAGGLLPRANGGRRTEVKAVRPGDRICLVGERTGRDAIHGAVIGSQPIDEGTTSSVVQLADPLAHKRLADFVIEAREQGLLQTVAPVGAGGLARTLCELLRFAGPNGGVHADLSRIHAKLPGIRPWELALSESQERMAMIVAPAMMVLFQELARARGIELSVIGEFNQSGRLELVFQTTRLASLDWTVLHEACPKLELRASWSGLPVFSESAPDAFAALALPRLRELLARPSISSKESLIRRLDHEVQGTAVIRAMNGAAVGTPQQRSGPNDASVIKPKASSWAGLAISSGILPQYSQIDPYLMAQLSVDESVRNLLCVGAEYGRPESVMALSVGLAWPDPVRDAERMGGLVRACYGVHDAAIALGLPILSARAQLRHELRTQLAGEPLQLSPQPTLLAMGVARVPDVRFSKSADFKGPGDILYLLGPGEFGLVGSELQRMLDGRIPGRARIPAPDWRLARQIFGWLGGDFGERQSRLRSVHDVSEGGLLVAVVEGLLAREGGAVVEMPEAIDPWEFCFGEGFHSFIVSVPEPETVNFEEEWRVNEVPFQRVGFTTPTGRLDLRLGSRTVFNAEVAGLAKIWMREGETA